MIIKDNYGRQVLAKLSDGVDCIPYLQLCLEGTIGIMRSYEKGKNYRIFQAKKKKIFTILQGRMCREYHMIFDVWKVRRRWQVLKVLNVVLEKLGMA